MADHEYIIYEKRGAIGYITLNRPEKLNALSRQLLAELEQACNEVRDDPEVKVCVIKGAGRCFSAGYDMNPDAEHQMPTSAIGVYTREADPDGLYYRAIWDNPKAFIAQVHSFCLAGGGHLACFCDITIAAEDTLFGYPPVRYASVGQALIWPWLVGMKKAKQLLLTGDMMDAQTALRVGLVNEVVPRDKLEEEVNKLANTIAKVPMESIWLNKRAINEYYELSGIRHAMRFTSALTAISYGSPPEALPRGLQDVNRVTAEEGMRAGFEFMNAPFIEEDQIASSQMARPDRRP